MVFDLLPQLADIDAQILRVLGMRRPPDGGQDLLVGDAPCRRVARETTAARTPSASA